MSFSIYIKLEMKHSAKYFLAIKHMLSFFVSSPSQIIRRKEPERFIVPDTRSLFLSRSINQPNQKAQALRKPFVSSFLSK
jgi:hypothetical protein